MEESFATRPLVGRWIALDVRPTRPLTWLGPAWATLCGALASGGLTLAGQSFLTLVLSLLLSDTLLGAWRALWLQSDWRAAVRRVATSGSQWLETPGETRGLRHRVRLAIRRLRYLYQFVWPLIDSEIMGLLTLGALALGVALMLGQVAVVLTSAAMVFALIEGQIGTTRGAGLRVVSEITVPWLIAQSAFGYFSWLGLVFALLFTLVYRALLGMATTHSDHWIAWSNLAQVAVVLLLVASNTAAGVGLVLLGLLAQVLWQARYRSDHDGQSYARNVQSYVLVAMLVCGLSLWF